MGVCGDSPVQWLQSHSMGGVRGEQRDTQEHTGTYTRMLHLPFSDLPLKKCPIKARPNSIIVIVEQSFYFYCARQSLASTLSACRVAASSYCHPGRHANVVQPAPNYHTTGCSRSSADSPGARTLVFAALEPFHSCEFRASIARTPFCAILWRSPSRYLLFVYPLFKPARVWEAGRHGRHCMATKESQQCARGICKNE